MSFVPIYIFTGSKEKETKKRKEERRQDEWL
jgi:hypothetical protein